jgi:aldose sugar dehydrogenase
MLYLKSIIRTIRLDPMAASLILSLVLLIGYYYYFDYASAQEEEQEQPSIVSDTALKIEPAVEGLSSPTSMAFLDEDNIMVLEKEGNVRLVANSILQEQPILQAPVNAEGERGLLGVAISNGSSSQTTTNVFLYYTEGDPLRNRIYKYQWNGETLDNPQLILDLPAGPRTTNHNGGKIVIGPDSYLYAVIGDQNHDGQLQNFPDGPPPDDTGVIFRVNPQNGSPASGNPLTGSGSDGEASLSKYYAYGIRNSFGIGFDPLTGNLWDTENGPASYDEINLLRPGFNSGWQTVMGPISLSGHTEDELVNFPGSHYADPVFSWEDPVAPTDIEFFNSSKLGDRYTNNIFVGDITTGNLYFFEANENRDGINFSASPQLQESGLSDLVVNNEEELSAITFASGFGSITDIETGPDGFLYVLSFDNGVIYKISPS